MRGVIETTHFLTSVLGARNPIVQGMRNTVIPLATHIPQFQRAFVDRLSGLQNTYKGSEIVDGNGRRLFADFMRHGQMGRRFHLLASGSFLPATSLAARMPQVIDFHDVEGDTVRLVRPDGYVAYESSRRTASATSEIEHMIAKHIRS